MINDYTRNIMEIHDKDLNTTVITANGMKFWDPIVLNWNEELWIRMYAENPQKYKGELIIPIKAFASPGEWNHEAGKWDFFWTESKDVLMMLKYVLTEKAGKWIEGTRIIGKDCLWTSRQLMEYESHPLKNKVELKRCTLDKLVQLPALMNNLGKIGIEPWIILGWFAAAPFRMEFTRKYEMFPIMHVVGEQGSGKTDIVKLFMRLFHWTGDLESFKVSEYVITRFLSSTDSFPIAFDEFFEDTEKNEILKLVPYATRWTKGQWRQGPSQVQMNLVAPVCLVGENSMTTPSLLERTLVVEMLKSKRLTINDWNYCLKTSINLYLGEYYEWAMEQTLPKPRPDERLRREDMGFVVVKKGLEMLNKWLEERTEGHASLKPPEITKDMCMTQKEFADDGIIFLRLAYSMYKSGEFDRNKVAIDEQGDSFILSMQQVWPYVKQRSIQIGTPVKDIRTLSKLLKNKSYTNGAPYTRRVKGQMTRAWSFSLDAIDKEDVEFEKEEEKK